MDKTVLVTGGNGFLAVHTILQLLRQGYTVKTTIRSFSKKDSIIRALNEGGLTNPDNLSFYEADLSADTGWDAATKNCDYVLHIASPFPAEQPKDENELIIPARDGSLRVLKAARDAGVKRVVLTSSFAAIGYSKDIENHIFTEADWTDEHAPIMPYIKSKTIAKRLPGSLSRVRAANWNCPLSIRWEFSGRYWAVFHRHPWTRSSKGLWPAKSPKARHLHLA